MEKCFVQLSGGRIFYRHFANPGRPALLLLHPSPLSSAFMERLALFLSTDFEVFAPDLPGYGFSDPLAQRPREMADYLPFLQEFLAKNNIAKAILYGTATGCQLAIAFALAHPEKTALLVGENACHFEADERAELLQSYFPDLTPRADGSHLRAAWEMCYKTCIGFPWMKVPDSAALPPGITPAFVQAMLRDTLLAGENYQDAYRAAFAHERAHKVQQLAVPAVFIIWSGSILAAQMERLTTFQMPENVRFVRCDGDITARYTAIKNILLHDQPA